MSAARGVATCEARKPGEARAAPQAVPTLRPEALACCPQHLAGEVEDQEAALAELRAEADHAVHWGEDDREGMAAFQDIESAPGMAEVMTSDMETWAGDLDFDWVLGTIEDYIVVFQEPIYQPQRMAGPDGTFAQRLTRAAEKHRRRVCAW